MNIETEKTMANVEAMAVQATYATLMNGSDQFCCEKNTRAESALEELIALERSHGNMRLLKIYSDALAELRRNRR